MFYLKEEMINKKIFERFKGWIMKWLKDLYSIDLFEFWLNYDFLIGKNSIWEIKVYVYFCV